MDCRDNFVECMHACRLMEISYISKKHGDSVITRTCAPWDVGPNSRSKDQTVHYYWVVDVSSPSGVHLTPIAPDRVVDAVPLEETFDPLTLGAGALSFDRFYMPRDW